RCATAAEPLPIPRLPAPRVEPAGLPPSGLGTRARGIPLMGHRPRADGARAGTLARPRHRELRPAARGLRGCARETALRGDRRVSADESPSPYKGLTPFEDSDLDVRFFFGRDRERELIEANLMASRLTVLYGETGVGKSSVLRAGVAHHLRSLAEQNLSARGEPGVAVVVFDAWRGDPARELRIAVAAAVTRALGGAVEPPDQDVPPAAALPVVGPLLAGPIYVVLDQAEEFFLYHGGDDRENGFAVEFPAVVNTPDLRVNFLLAIREDALAKLDLFKARIPNVLGNYVRLEHLDQDAARAAIVE